MQHGKYIYTSNHVSKCEQVKKWNVNMINDKIIYDKLIIPRAYTS